MTIEERAIQDWGITENPELGVWMLRDGRLLNGSYEGHQRDVDHSEISQYFKHSAHQEPGSSLIYIHKFMRRGNLRWHCNECGYGFDYTITPSTDQIRNIFKYMRIAQHYGVETYIGHRISNHTKYFRFQDWVAHMRRYTRALEKLHA